MIDIIGMIAFFAFVGGIVGSALMVVIVNVITGFNAWRDARRLKKR